MVPSNVLQTKRVISDKNSLWDGLTGESVSRKIDVKVGVAYMHLALLGPNHTNAYSGAFRTPVPGDSGHLFHLIPDSHSSPFRTLCKV